MICVERSSSKFQRSEKVKVQTRAATTMSWPMAMKVRGLTLNNLMSGNGLLAAGAQQVGGDDERQVGQGNQMPGLAGLQAGKR